MNIQDKISRSKSTNYLEKKLYIFLYFALFTNKPHSIVTTSFKMLIIHIYTYTASLKNKIYVSLASTYQNIFKEPQTEQFYKNNFFNPDNL